MMKKYVGANGLSSWSHKELHIMLNGSPGTDYRGQLTVNTRKINILKMYKRSMTSERRIQPVESRKTDGYVH